MSEAGRGRQHSSPPGAKAVQQTPGPQHRQLLLGRIIYLPLIIFNAALRHCSIEALWIVKWRAGAPNDDNVTMVACQASPGGFRHGNNIATKHPSSEQGVKCQIPGLS